MGLAARIAKAVLLGILEGALLILGYAYLLPWATSKVLGPYAEGLHPIQLTQTYLATIGIILGLSTAARALEGTVFSPILRSSSALFAYLVYVYYIGINRMVEVTLRGSTYVEKIRFDLLPIAASAAIFLLAPSVVLPFISYFERLAEE